MITLRDYQIQAVHDCRVAISQGMRRILLVAPTGSGKTVIASHIIDRAADKGSHVLFGAHRRELVHQCGDKLLSFGCDHGLIMAGEFLQMEYEVQVASIDTLRVRAMNANRMPMPKADIIFIDEAHRSVAPTYVALIEAYPDAVVIGMTATPVRGDGKGLGHIYDGMVNCPSVAQLTTMGHLVPVRYWAPTIPDLTGVKVRGGDYVEKDLQEALDKRKLVGDIYTNWARIAANDPTIIFASGVSHSMHIRDEFARHGVKVAHVDGNTDKHERDQILKDLKTGAVQVVSNCMVLTEGFDEPGLATNVLARPTKNVGLYLQMAGRTLRPADGKDHCKLIDHSGNVYQHGYVTDERDWQLTEGKALGDNKEHELRLTERKVITCIQCSATYEGSPVCPECGHRPQMRGRYLETKHADLMELKERKTAKKRTFTMKEKQEWYAQLQHIREKRGRSDGWVSNTYRKKFGVWPNGPARDIYNQWGAVPPSKEVSGFVRHCDIAYAKSMDARRATNATTNQASGHR